MKKNNKKGFSLLELIIILCLTSTFGFLLFQSIIKQTSDQIFEKIGSVVIKNYNDNNFSDFQSFKENFVNGNILIEKTSISPSSINNSGLKISIINATKNTCNIAYKIPKNTKLYLLTINGKPVSNLEDLKSTCDYFSDKINIQQYVY